MNSPHPYGKRQAVTSSPNITSEFQRNYARGKKVFLLDAGPGAIAMVGGNLIVGREDSVSTASLTVSDGGVVNMERIPNCLGVARYHLQVASL